MAHLGSIKAVIANPPDQPMPLALKPSAVTGQISMVLGLIPVAAGVSLVVLSCLKSNVYTDVVNFGEDQ